jgi:hypothetical protein
LTRPAEAVPVSKLSRPPRSRGPKCAQTGGNIRRGSGEGRPAPLPLPVLPSCGPLSRTRQLLPMRNRGYCRDACRPGAPSSPAPFKTIPYYSAHLCGKARTVAGGISQDPKCSRRFLFRGGRIHAILGRRVIAAPQSPNTDGIWGSSRYPFAWLWPLLDRRSGPSQEAPGSSRSVAQPLLVSVELFGVLARGRRGAREIRGIVDAPRPLVGGHQRIRAQRTRPVHLHCRRVRGNDLVRRFPLLYPLLQR